MDISPGKSQLEPSPTSSDDARGSGRELIRHAPTRGRTRSRRERTRLTLGPIGIEELRQLAKRDPNLALTRGRIAVKELNRQEIEGGELISSADSLEDAERIFARRQEFRAKHREYEDLFRDLRADPNGYPRLSRSQQREAARSRRTLLGYRFKGGVGGLPGSYGLTYVWGTGSGTQRGPGDRPAATPQPGSRRAGSSRSSRSQSRGDPEPEPEPLTGVHRRDRPRHLGREILPAVLEALRPEGSA